MSGFSEERTQLTLYGSYEKEECGYCHQGQSCAYGMVSKRMTIDDYQYLMFRGFRRSGTFFYKPTMHKVSHNFQFLFVS
jgi:arginyl-tRNA---protein transferase